MWSKRDWGYGGLVGIVVAMIVVSMLGGFNRLQESHNPGGTTSCGEFVTQGLDTQHVTVRKFLEQQSSSSAEPGDGTVDRAISAVLLACRTQGDPEIPIGKAAVDATPESHARG
ncbi:hypothetical protein NDR87_36155 [Nocardia sp. CDC159]|uniref:Uncharacterized protein n=1 Tax=Nocardia pulmonis TaxID=2951408 RepID=A0A9X2EIU7_9NOCA|nr:MULTISPECIES: hypothetical protein [Nocardia]MCM6778936.1 hypothetical protein [Nocardia pulmonis]MCM6791811.1 hypothetical protein [Nocardia sp. CDC159]